MVLQRDDQAGQALEVQPVVLSNLQSHAKLCKGDGEVQHEAPAYSQPKATGASGEGEEQRLCGLRWPQFGASHHEGNYGSAGCESQMS